MTEDQSYREWDIPEPLRRPGDDRVLGGVCAGIAERLGVDSIWIRILAMALAVISFGGVVFVYLVAWTVIPPGPAAQTRNRSPFRAVDAVMTALGSRLRGPETPESPLPRPVPEPVPGARL